MQISGAGLTSPVKITLASEATAGSAITDLKTAVNTAGSATANALKAAGISVSQSGSGPLIFTSATGENFSVQATGDTKNLLGWDP